MAILDCGDFSLELNYVTYDLFVCVKGNSYSGNFSIYCSEEDYKKFVAEISDLYKTLREGKAEIRDCYEHNFICFESDGKGHFFVSGAYNDWGNWNLKFFESCDQTYLKKFTKFLQEE